MKIEIVTWPRFYSWHNDRRSAPVIRIFRHYCMGKWAVRLVGMT
jgi:hypothetical protein